MTVIGCQFNRGGRRGYVLAAPLCWNIGKKQSEWLLIIPEGTEFESSVPALLRWALSPDDPAFLKAAVIHDFLLESGFKRAFADSQWLEAALSEQAPPFKARIAYVGMVARRQLRGLRGEPPEEPFL